MSVLPRFSDFAHASYCDQRTFESIQKVALEGVYGKRQGHLKFYDNLNAEELRKELKKRGCKEYPNSKHGKLGILKIFCVVFRGFILISIVSCLSNLCMT